MSDVQQTLRDRIEFAGVGLHTGRAARAVVEPAPVDSGFSFRLEGGVTFPATSDYVVDTRRATVLGSSGATVSTVEHLLSALRGMGVDNATIVSEGGEIPVMDGSAKIFADAIAATGLLEQNAPRRYFRPAGTQRFEDGDKAVTIAPAPSWRIDFSVDFPAPIGAQHFALDMTPEFYHDEIAPARTFGYLHEIEALRAAGLAQGGSLDNALVFANDGPMQPLRWHDEVVRHKILDMIGDFTLLGLYPQCEAVALKSGHKLHATAVAALRNGQRSHQEAAS